VVGINAVRVVALEAGFSEAGITRLEESARTMPLRATAGIALAATPLMAAEMQTYVAKVQANPATVRPRDSLRIEPSLPTAKLARALGLSGPSATFGGWPHGGWHALAWATANLALGRTDQMLIGAWADQPDRLVWVLLGEHRRESLAGIRDLQWAVPEWAAERFMDLADLAGPVGWTEPRSVVAAGGALSFTFVPSIG
jgi:hypothetical protein